MQTNRIDTTLKNDVTDCVQAIFNGGENGIKSLIQTVIHPLDEFVYPVSELIYDATILLAAHANKFDIQANEDFGLLKKMIDKNSQVYHDAAERMELRIDNVKRLGDEFVKVSWQKKVEMLSEAATTILVPGYFVQGVKIASNINKFGTFSHPPKFHNLETNDLIFPTPKVEILTKDKISKQFDSKHFMYVINKDGKLLLANEKLPKELRRMTGYTYLAHPELANLEEVIAAGTVKVSRGKVRKIDNHSGHYRPDSSHLHDVVETVFARHGFTEARGKFQYVNPDKITQLYPIISQVKLSGAPSVIGISVGTFQAFSQEVQKEFEYPSFIFDAEASEDDTCITEDNDSEQVLTDDTPPVTEKSKQTKKNTDNTEKNEMKTKSSEENALETTDSKISQEQFQKNLRSAQSAFADVIGLGAMLNNNDLYKAGVIGESIVKISDSLNALNVNFPLLNRALSGVALAQPYIAGIAAVVQIGMTLFGRKKTDASAQANMMYMQTILTGLATIRKELHIRFDITDHKIMQLSVQVDQVYYSLKDVMQANHDLELRNIHYVAKSLGEDIEQLGKILTSRIENVHLDELDKLLIHIQDHKNGQIFGDKNVKLELLLEANSKLDSLWILKNLIGHNYNGGIYFSDSTQQSKHYVKDSILPEAALGFLLQYATTHLKLNEKLADIDSKKLPLVDLWSHAIQASLTAHVIAAQQYEHALPEEPFKEIETVTKNTILMVNTLADNAIPLFTELTVKYKQAHESLISHFKNHLKKVIKENDNFYSLEYAITNTWFDLSTLLGRFDANFQHKIISQSTAKELKLPLIFMLAQKFKLITLSAPEVFNRLPGSAYWKSTAAHVKRQVALGEKNLGMDYSFKLTTSEGVVILKVDSSIPQVESWGYVHKDMFETVRNQKNSHHSHVSSSTTDKHLVANSNIQSVVINANIKDYFNGLLLDKIADAIVKAKISGDVLPENVNELYSKAVGNALLDSASGAETVDTIYVSKKMMIVYTELFGLPSEAIQSIYLNMESDAKTLLQSPSQIATLQSRLDVIMDQMRKALPHRNSRIIQKMLSVNNSIDIFHNLSQYCHQYNEKLSAWTADVKFLSQILHQLHYMQAICEGENLSLCEHANWADIKNKLDEQAKALSHLHQNLLDQYLQISNFGITTTRPPSLQSILEQNPIPELHISNEKSLVDADDLGYSLKKTVAQLEEFIKKMSAVPKKNLPAHLRTGKSGRGKSTLTNFSEGGITYKEYLGKTGQTLVRPRNGIQENPRTGEGESTTTFPGFFLRDNISYVDFPGFVDTKGMEEDICNAFLIPAAARKFTALKTLEIVMSSADIYDHRYHEVMEIIGKVAVLIAKNPEELISNIVITVTMPDKARLAKNGPFQYESEVLAHLKNWLKDAFMVATHPHYALAMLISKLRLDNIIIVDVTDPSHRWRYHDRIHKISPSNTNQFDFRNFDKNAQSFKRFNEKLEAHYKKQKFNRDEYIAVLSHYWKKLPEEIAHNQPPISWPLFENSHNQLIEVSRQLNGPFITVDQFNHDITGNVVELVQTAISYSRELKNIKPIYDRLNQITVMIDDESIFTSYPSADNEEIIDLDEIPNENVLRTAAAKLNLGEKIDSWMNNFLFHSPYHINHQDGFSLQVERESARINEELSLQIEKESLQINDHSHPFVGVCNSNPDPDRETGEPIFFCTASKNGKIAGQAKLYGQPSLCVSEDMQRNNVIEGTGAFLNAEPDEGEICRVLPPTMQDKLLASATNGAAHGALRGGAKLLGDALEKQGVSKNAANNVGHAAYYCGIFSMSLALRSQNIKDLDSCLNVMYQSAVETGEVLVINAGLTVFAKLFSTASDAAKDRKCGWTSRVLGKCSSVVRYGVFVKKAAENGIATTAASLTAGTATQVLVEQVGKRLQRS